MKKLVDYIQYLQLFTTFLVVATFPLSDMSPLYRVAIYSFCATFVIDVVVSRRYAGIVLDRKRIYFFAMLALFLLGFAYLPFSQTQQWFKPMMEYRLPLLIFSIVGLFGLNSKHRFSYFIYALPVLTFLYAAYVFTGIDIKEFILSDNKTGMFMVSRIAKVNHHMRYNFFMNMGILSTLWIFVKFKTTRLTKAIYVLVTILPAYTLFITEGRSGFLGFILVILVIILYFAVKYRNWILLGVYTVMFVVGVVYGLSGNFRFSPQIIREEPRLFLWHDVAIPLIAERPLLGYGVSDAQSETMRLKDERLPKSLEHLWTPEDRVDVHNQYLQTYLEFGIIGELLLLFLYLFPITMVCKGREVYMAAFIMLSMWQSLFDLFIVGQFGVIFCLMIIIMLLPSEPDDAMNKELGI